MSDAKRPVFGVRLNKEAFTFAAAHFITYSGDICEPLHGHNYRVEAEVTGPLDENRYVVDFIATRDALAKLTAELDHRMLLPTEHPAIRVERAVGPLGGEEVVATFEDRRWVFPAGECVLLPIANTTAELLARYLAERLRETLPAGCGLTVLVDECEGQAGFCRL